MPQVAGHFFLGTRSLEDRNNSLREPSQLADQEIGRTLRGLNYDVDPSPRSPVRVFWKDLGQIFDVPHHDTQVVFADPIINLFKGVFVRIAPLRPVAFNAGSVWKLRQ